jgi:Ca2+/Na+ antiporter
MVKKILDISIINIILFILFTVGFYVVAFVLGYATDDNSPTSPNELYVLCALLNVTVSTLILLKNDWNESKLIGISAAQLTFLYIIIWLVTLHK